MQKTAKQSDDFAIMAPFGRHVMHAVHVAKKYRSKHHTNSKNTNKAYAQGNKVSAARRELVLV